MKVCLDSRLIKEGEYFVAVVGDNFDGHNFIKDVRNKGAKGILEEEGLYELAKKTLDEIKPEVIAVTGSTGKTSTKEMIATILSQKFRVLKSEGTLNTKLGLAVDIVNKLQKSHQKLVVEVGMDRIGEIKETCRLIKPHIGVVTFINPTHQEKLKTLENTIKAKGELLEALPKDGVAVLNWDDENVRPLSKKCECPIIWYGETEGARIRPNFITVKIPLLGEHQIYNVLAAVAVGKLCGLTGKQINNGVKKVTPLKGRLNLLDGINGSKILDDTYNSSPKSSVAALKVLKNFPAKRRTAILGDMLELGKFEKEGHRLVGQMVADSSIDALITTGKILQHYVVLNNSTEIYKVDSNARALEILLEKIRPRKGDVILVKGSRGIRMERIVEKLLKEPSKAKDVLVCQDIRWTG